MAGCYEYYADLAEKLDGEQDTPIEVPMEEFKTVLRREPLGPVGLISAWNCAFFSGIDQVPNP